MGKSLQLVPIIQTSHGHTLTHSLPLSLCLSLSFVHTVYTNPLFGLVLPLAYRIASKLLASESKHRAFTLCNNFSTIFAHVQLNLL